MFEILLLIWFFGALVTFGLMAGWDIVRGPRIDGWFNLAAAVIWPAVLLGGLLNKLKGRS